MKFLIIGKEYTGKHEIRNELQSIYGWNIPLPITSRPKKDPFDNEFNFILPEEMKNISENDIVSRANIKNTDCIILKSQIMNADALIVLPEQIKEITQAFPNEWFSIIEIEPCDDDTRYTIATKYENGKTDIKEQIDAEDAKHQKAFEEVANATSDNPINKNCRYIGYCTQQYTTQSVSKIATAIVKHKRVVTKLTKMLKQLGDAGIATIDDMKIEILEGENETPKNMHLEGVVEAMVITQPTSNGDHFIKWDTVLKWLELEESYIPDLEIIPSSNPNETPMDE